METIKIIQTLGAESVWLGGGVYLSKTLEVATPPGAQIHVAHKLKFLSGVPVNLWAFYLWGYLSVRLRLLLSQGVEVKRTTFSCHKLEKDLWPL